MAMATLISWSYHACLYLSMDLNVKAVFHENSCICMCQLLVQLFSKVMMILVHVVSADVVRYRNESTRYSPTRASAQYITFKKSKPKKVLMMEANWFGTFSYFCRQNAKSSTIGRLTTQVIVKLFKCSSFRLTDLFCRRAMQESNLFYLWLVNKGMIHEPTLRFNGFFGDNCNSCCVDQKVCVGINCLPSTYIVSIPVYCLMITLLDINVGSTL